MHRNTIVNIKGTPPVKLGDLLGKLPEDLRPLARKLSPQIKRVTGDVLTGHFQIGLDIKEEHDKVQALRKAEGKTMYGAGFYKHLGIALNYDPRTLWDCHKAAETFTPERYQTLLVDQGLSWGHVRHLADVPTDQRRRELATKAAKGGWTAEQLAEEMDGGTSKVPAPRGPGRSPAVPRSLKAAIKRFVSLSAKYTRTTGQVLFGNRFDIADEIQNLSPEEVTAETRDLVVECADQVAELERTLRGVRDRLKTAREWIDSAMAAKAKANLAEETGETDETDNK